jgi:AcrR family transcriptional regulator
VAELPEPGTERGRKTRDRLFDAAEHIFHEVGFESASVTTITQRAEVAQGSFYTYFPSKHALFVELIMRFSEQLRRAIAIATANGSQTRAAVERRAIEAYFDYLVEHPALYTMVHESRVVAPDVYEWWQRGFANRYVQNFDRITATRPPNVDTETLAYAMAGIADMLALRWIIWEKRVPPTSVLDQVFALLARGLDDVLGESSQAQDGISGTDGTSASRHRSDDSR